VLQPKIFLSEKLTALKVSLCLSVVAGVVLVVQPTFIFGLARTESTPEDLSTYYLGVAVSLVCASSAGLTNVASAKTRGMPRAILMVAGGVGTLAVALIGIGFKICSKRSRNNLFCDHATFRDALTFLLKSFLI
jgi:drug/metabolite transporter (DMT)-like permease